MKKFEPNVSRTQVALMTAVLTSSIAVHQELQFVLD
jgi:hypothetical protein